ncbi:glycoside hydrolase family 3 N-terminal domain-containing protein [Microbacterium aquimaris]|uniref:glycoside hydrolase family 3 N-terminal domain-containing protein n=1 Tax=Microbacterium aquimaris TaxID=459816 RepID=UPI002AD23AFD|nr:glycoside hydrolase family 3 N-terminal domain-containing protein [Microbacterium aquimaris]MDZ8275908.1 glycoside hydrolase family 3 N-terminal domain-containing protein [Microbacterium aquimaris]
MSRLLRTAVSTVLSAALVVGVTSAATASARGNVSSGPDGAPVTVVAAGERDLQDAAAALVETMTLRERAASVVMGHLPTTDTAALREYMQTDSIGGFILMGANVPADEAALREVAAALTVDEALPPLLAIDQEGGDVSRLPWDDFPAAPVLKEASAPDVADAFAGRASLVDRGGLNVNFGIVADVTADRGMFIYRRALGADPATAADHVAAAVRGEHGLSASTLKHFPGHGAAPGDSHAGIPTTDMPYDEWATTQAPPFVAGIDAGAPLLMFGHLTYTAVDDAPASLSPEWHRIAREELGFDGVAVTDDLGMLQASGIPTYADPVANGVAALVAGNDLVLTVLYSDAGSAERMVDGIVAAVDDGTLPVDRLTEAAERVTALRLASADTALIPCPECAAVR